MEEIRAGDCDTHMNGHMLSRKKSNTEVIIGQPWVEIALNSYEGVKNVRNMHMSNMHHFSYYILLLENSQCKD